MTDVVFQVNYIFGIKKGVIINLSKNLQGASFLVGKVSFTYFASMSL